MTDSALIGQTIAGRFKITGFIGEGAMASVYRGVQEAEPRDVAVKIMHAHLARDATFLGRFRREAKAASLLQHPNTVQIIDYGADKDRVYIAMELIGGQDLFEMLVVERRFSEARAARIVAQVCDALTSAHARGIIHRDLKPENVMVLPHPADPRIEHVKVLDFGIAKVLERDKGQGPTPDSSSDDAPSSLVASALTTVGVVVGTPAYMSPEQCRAEPVDARSDVYSCGILLYQLICGRTPFSGDSPIEIAINQVRMPPDPPSSVIPSIHPELEQIILTSLEKWPAQRQQSAAELRDVLLALVPRLSDERKGLADGKQPPPPEVHIEDRAPPSEDASDLAATLRMEEGVGPPPKGMPGLPTLSPRLPAGVSGPFASNQGAPMSQPMPSSSDPFSVPPSLAVFPRPIGGPVSGTEPIIAHAAVQRASAPDRLEVAPMQGLPMQMVTRRPPPRPGLPSWAVLILAIVVGVGVGIAAHFLAR